jgi:hypothetical protein
MSRSTRSRLCSLLATLALTGSACCTTTQPLQDLAATESEYFWDLDARLSEQRDGFVTGLGNVFHLDFARSEARLARARAKNLAAARFHELQSQGVEPKRARQIAGAEFLDEQEEILVELRAAKARREERIRGLTALYSEIQESVAALADNQEEISAYLELSWWGRTFKDVKGLDREGLKRLGRELKDLRGELAGGGD